MVLVKLVVTVVTMVTMDDYHCCYIVVCRCSVTETPCRRKEVAADKPVGCDFFCSHVIRPKRNQSGNLVG